MILPINKNSIVYFWWQAIKRLVIGAVVSVLGLIGFLVLITWMMGWK